MIIERNLQLITMMIQCLLNDKMSSLQEQILFY